MIVYDRLTQSSTKRNQRQRNSVLMATIHACEKVKTIEHKTFIKNVEIYWHLRNFNTLRI